MAGDEHERQTKYVIEIPQHPAIQSHRYDKAGTVIPTNHPEIHDIAAIPLTDDASSDSHEGTNLTLRDLCGDWVDGNGDIPDIQATDQQDDGHGWVFNIYQVASAPHHGGPSDKCLCQ